MGFTGGSFPDGPRSASAMGKEGYMHVHRSHKRLRKSDYDDKIFEADRR
jgi:hypothetical protein